MVRALITAILPDQQQLCYLQYSEVLNACMLAPSPPLTELWEEQALNRGMGMANLTDLTMEKTTIKNCRRPTAMITKLMADACTYNKMVF